jgi:hypothetical protein
VDSGVGDVDAGAFANVESISIVATVVIAVSVVDSDAAQGEVASTVDAEDLDGRVLDIDVLDLGVDHLVGVEELGLGLATVGSLSVPPAGTIAIEDGSGSSLDGNVGSGNRDEGTRPLLVAESGLTFKDDLFSWSVGSSNQAADWASHGSSLFQTSQIKGSTRRNSDRRKDNSRASSLRRDGRGGTLGARESTSGRALLNFRCTSGRGSGMHGGSTEQADQAELKTKDHDVKNE